MKNEIHWLKEQGRQADLDFEASGDNQMIGQFSLHLHARIEHRRNIVAVTCMLFLCASVSVLSWQVCKLDWQMSQSAWPAYVQYQQNQVQVGR